jgi:hypothetical protein
MLFTVSHSPPLLTTPLLCAPAVVNGPPPCGCSHHAFSSFSGATDDCQTRSVPSAFGFLGGATVSTTIPPMSTALLGPLVFKPAVRVSECVCMLFCSVYVCVCALSDVPQGHGMPLTVLLSTLRRLHKPTYLDGRIFSSVAPSLYSLPPFPVPLSTLCSLAADGGSARLDAISSQQPDRC